MATRQGSTADYFLAALVHDIGKTLIDKSGQWSDHEVLDRHPYAKPLAHLAAFAQEHDQPVLATDPPSPAAALKLADKLQKALHGEDRDGDEAVAPLKSSMSFHPYYGRPQPINQSWSRVFTGEPGLADALNAVAKSAKQAPPPAAPCLRLQTHLRECVHTSYLPHLSLAVHHQMTAVLYAFVWRAIDGLRTVGDCHDVTFSITTLVPERMRLFYRLRDVRAQHEATRGLADHMFREVYLPMSRELGVEFHPQTNPFNFFAGDALVLVHSDANEVIAAAQRFLDAPHGPGAGYAGRLQAIEVRVLNCALRRFHMTDDGTLRARHEDIDSSDHTSLLVPERLRELPPASASRCVRCNEPLEGEAETCTRCSVRLKGVASIDRISDDGRKRLVYTFLSFPPDLRAHATAVARNTLLKHCTQEHGLQPGTLSPTPQGLFEHLEAASAVSRFQVDVCDQIAKIETAGKCATLASLPDLCVWVHRESEFWPFWGRLARARQDMLKLDSHLSVVACPPRTPIWNLMAECAQFRQGPDRYYDLSGGSVVEFSQDEVESIRRLAEEARREARRVRGELNSVAALNALSLLANNVGLPTLLLEIDVRATARPPKLGRDFTAGVKDALGRITGDERKSREKRALFIRYIAKLRGEDRRGV